MYRNQSPEEKAETFNAIFDACDDLGPHIPGNEPATQKVAIVFVAQGAMRFMTVSKDRIPKDLGVPFP